MYISELLLDRSLGLNPYEIHRNLWQFFPGRPDDDRPFLYRVSTERGNEPLRVLMQSTIEPDSSAVSKACLLLRKKEFNPSLSEGQFYRFLLCANPVKMLSKERCRVPLVDEQQLYGWLSNKLAGGARVEGAQITEKKNLHFRKDGKAGKVVTVTFTGLLSVSSSAVMMNLLQKGIGKAKSFGCGLLSLARV